MREIRRLAHLHLPAEWSPVEIWATLVDVDGQDTGAPGLVSSRVGEGRFVYLAGDLEIHHREAGYEPSRKASKPYPSADRECDQIPGAAAGRHPRGGGMGVTRFRYVKGTMDEG